MDAWVRGWVGAWSIYVCHGLLMYAHTCVDVWSLGYTCKGIMSGGCVDACVRGWVGAWSIHVCHGLLMYAYTCVDRWSSGYTCKGIMSEWMRGCVDARMRGCVGGWARGQLMYVMDS